MHIIIQLPTLLLFEINVFILISLTQFYQIMTLNVTILSCISKQISKVGNWVLILHNVAVGAKLLEEPG
jgi:hypothetical protein